MQPQKTLKAFRHYLESLPIFIVLDTQYSKNKNSSISSEKPVNEQYEELVKKLQDVLMDKLQNNPRESVRELPFTTLFSLSDMIIYSLAKSSPIFQHIMNPDYISSYLPCHSLNVAFIGCKIGMGMRFSYEQLNQLGVAALLHDVGMTQLPPSLYESENELPPEKRKAIESHSVLGYQFFEKLKNDFPWLLRVILETHKRENNKGYPDLVKDEPHIYSKIIGIADTFEALTHNRAFRKAYHPSDAIKTIINGKMDFFAKNILRALIESLAIYPIGSLVQLNNKNIAAVVDTIEGSPMRPIVQVVSEDNLHETADQRIINLSEENNLYITGLVYSTLYLTPDKIKKLQ